MPHTQDAPPATGFATLGDASTIPYVRDYAGLDGYAKFLALDLPRAFVIAPSGHWHYRGGEADALRTALERCQTAARQPCKPYAVDDAVVWTP